MLRQRLFLFVFSESTSRSPIYSHFGETLSGTPTIRAFNLEDRFILENEAKVDSNQACYQPSIAANRYVTPDWIPSLGSRKNTFHSFKTT
jgi:hypothetical protein